MTGKITEIQEYLIEGHETATSSQFAGQVHRNVTMRLDFDDSTLRLTKIGAYIGHNIRLPIEMFPSDVKIGDEFTVYFEAKR